MKRIVVLFIVAQLLLLVVFYLTLNSDFNLNLIALDGEDTIIEIIGSNRASHKLELNPDFVSADAGKKVIWRIAEAAKDVRTFDIEPKTGHPDVFKCDPPVGNRRRPAVGHLKSQRKRIEYQYSIHWVDRDGNPHPDDPKIAIRPGTKMFELFIYILYPLLAGITTYVTFRKQRSSETRPT